MELNKDTIEALKKRIIATNTILQSLKVANEELEKHKTTINTLNTNLQQITQQSQANEIKYNNSLKEIDYWKQKAETSETLPSDKALIEQLKADVAAKNKTLYNKTSYINQLEAKLVKFQKNQEGASSLSGKPDTGLKKKNEELSALNKRIVALTNELNVVKSELNETKAAKEQLEEDIMEININNDMNAQSQQEEIDELKQKLQNNKLYEDNEELKSKLQDKTNEIANLKDSLRLLTENNKQKDIYQNQAIDKYMKQISELKSRLSSENTLYSENNKLKKQLRQLEIEKEKKNEELDAQLQQARTETANINEELEKVKQECVQLRAKIITSQTRKSPSITKSVKSTPPTINADIVQRLCKLQGEAKYYKKENAHLRDELMKLHIELEAAKMNTASVDSAYGLEGSPMYISSLNNMDDDSIVISSPLENAAAQLFPPLSEPTHVLDTERAEATASTELAVQSSISANTSLVSSPKQIGSPVALSNATSSEAIKPIPSAAKTTSSIPNVDTKKTPVNMSVSQLNPNINTASITPLDAIMPKLSTLNNTESGKQFNKRAQRGKAMTSIPMSLSNTSTPPVTAVRSIATVNAPLPAATTSRKMAAAGKRKESRLMKFVNSRDPAKFLSQKREVASKKTGQTSKKRDSSQITNSVIAAQEAMHKRQKADFPIMYDFQHMCFDQRKLPEASFFNDKAEPIMNELVTFQKNCSSDPYFEIVQFEQFGVEDVLTIEVFTGMNSYEKLFALLVVRMGHVNFSEYIKFMKILTHMILNYETTEVLDSHLLRYIRLATIIIKSVNCDAEQLRLIITELLKSKIPQSNILGALVNVGYVWKEVFLIQENEMVTVSFKLWEDAFQACLITVVQKYYTNNQVKELYEKIVSLFEWKSIPPKVNEILDRSLELLSKEDVVRMYELDKVTFEHFKYNLIKSLEITFVTIGSWQETYDIFIRTKLWPLLRVKVADAICIELLGVLGSLGVSKEKNKKDEPGVLILINTLVQIIEMGASIELEDKRLQFAACKALLSLVANSNQKYIEYAKPAMKFINSL
ncbi:uncharacterized protein BX663DRAFT_543218 [Cokeromyces recurvatus]|uniref:uncharacterized protein n=1 Tax=Cokeromyces recurvatus TaxID=90255 RepID=UPI00222127F7|nr:uncharacterized protein BX663DRAFT_543218 [Cokeromyces recurvatus]KAI7902705.1 hypothetical protein BX663DRAFT_543218 [Cokeromyces recurvatus]